MVHMIAKTAATRGDAVALLDERTQRSFTELNQRANQIAHALRAAGIGKGDRIALFAGNSVQNYEIMSAAGHMGIYYVPINWHFSAEELAYVVNNSEAQLLFADTRFADTVEAAMARADAPNIPAPLYIDTGEGLRDGQRDFETFLTGQSAQEPEEQTMGGPMFYTSGTTGRPKGVLSANATGEAPVAAMEMMAAGLSGMLQIPADGTTLLAGPVYHSAQWAFSNLPLLAGSKVVMTHRFDAAQCLDLIDAHNVTNVHLVPTQFHRLLRVDEAAREAFSGASLQVAWHGAAPCPPEVKRGMIEWWGPCVSEYYGSTEGSIVSSISAEEWLQRPTSVGKATPIMEIRIIKEDGSLAQANEAGTIYMKSAMGTQFEYYKEPEKTKEAYLEPGLFTTGDIGFLDDDGYLHLSDRKIDMIISGGVNIYPKEIEAVLMDHPLVNDAAVFGVPNEEYGEEVKAAVQLDESAAQTSEQSGSADLAQTLIQHCQERLARYKAPKSVDFVADFPRTETGKLQKRLLRAPYWEGQERKI